MPSYHGREPQHASPAANRSARLPCVDSGQSPVCRPDCAEDSPKEEALHCLSLVFVRSRWAGFGWTRSGVPPLAAVSSSSERSLSESFLPACAQHLLSVADTNPAAPRPRKNRFGPSRLKKLEMVSHLKIRWNHRLASGPGRCRWPERIFTEIGQKAVIRAA